MTAKPKNIKLPITYDMDGNPATFISVTKKIAKPMTNEELFEKYKWTHIFMYQAKLGGDTDTIEAHNKFIKDAIDEARASTAQAIYKQIIEIFQEYKSSMNPINPTEKDKFLTDIEYKITLILRHSKYLKQEEARR